MVTLATAPAAESIGWRGPTAIAKLLTDSARSRLATITHVTLESSDGHIARDILGHGYLDDTITIKNVREGLVTTSRDRMGLTKGREETFDDVIWTLHGTVV